HVEIETILTGNGSGGRSGPAKGCLHALRAEVIRVSDARPRLHRLRGAPAQIPDRRCFEGDALERADSVRRDAFDAPAGNRDDADLRESRSHAHQGDGSKRRADPCLSPFRRPVHRPLHAGLRPPRTVTLFAAPPMRLSAAAGRSSTKLCSWPRSRPNATLGRSTSPADFPRVRRREPPYPTPRRQPDVLQRKREPYTIRICRRYDYRAVLLTRPVGG